MDHSWQGDPNPTPSPQFKKNLPSPYITYKTMFFHLTKISKTHKTTAKAFLFENQYHTMLLSLANFLNKAFSNVNS